MEAKEKKETAVALSYDKTQAGAPRIIGAGERKLAGEMKRIARRYGIPICRQAALAGELSALGEDADVPQELFDSLARAWVKAKIRQ